MQAIRTRQELEAAVKAALRDFRRCLAAASVETPPPELAYELDIRWPPHRAPGALRGRGAVCSFFWPERGEFLKVGKAGSGTEPRYRYQHYGDKAGSTLFKDLRANCRELGVPCEDEALRDWMHENLARADILLAPGYDELVLSLLEAFLHLRWRPRYEGSRGRRG